MFSDMTSQSSVKQSIQDFNYLHIQGFSYLDPL